MSEAPPVVAGPPPLRHVVLRHDRVPEPHFDLMFETAPGSPLATWRSPDWPLEPDTPLTPLADHRPAYLTYEGPVSGGRGTVSRVAEGSHVVLDDTVDSLIVTLENGVPLRLPRAPAPSAD